MQYCNNKSAYVVGADKVVSLIGFDRYLNKSFWQKEEDAKEILIGPQRMRDTNDNDIMFHVNAFYDFESKKWLNQVPLSDFDEGLWANYDYYYPQFPVVNDVLGTVLILNCTQETTVKTQKSHS